MPPKPLGVLSNDIILGVYIFILTFQVLCSFINGYILFLFTTRKDLRTDKHMRLVIYLSLGDFLLAIGELPYIIYMIINWNQKKIDYDPLYIMITAQPLPLQLKVSATITVGIALGRNIAVFFPSIYRRMDQGDFSNCVILVAVLLALFDVVLYWCTTTIEHHVNCGSVGCFLSNEFRYYWGISNMFLGFTAVFLSITVFWKIRLVSRNEDSVNTQTGSNRYAKANRTSTGILMSCLLFLTVPSVFVGVVDLTGFSIFELIGPFYSACLLVSGCCNGIIFIASNWDNVKPKKKLFTSVLVVTIPTVHSMAQSGGAWH